MTTSWTRPHFETLERRVLLSSSPLFPGSESPSELLGGSLPALSATRFVQAIAQGWGRLSVPLPGASTSGLPSRESVEVDFDGDGLGDRAEIQYPPESNSAVLELIRTLPEGGTEPLLSLALGDVVRGILAEDLDADGNVDLFLPGLPGQGLLLLGRGNGAFDAFLREEPRNQLAIADLTGDGLDEILFMDQASDIISMKAAEGGLPENAMEPLAGMQAQSIDLVDLDGDGHQDLIVGDGVGRLLFYPGLGNGQFGPEVYGGKGIQIGVGPIHVAFAFLGDRQFGGGEGVRPHDPFLDMVAVCQTTNEMLVFHGTGKWQMTLDQQVHFGRALTSVLLRDLDEDGRLESIVTSSGDDSVLILPGTEGGFFDAEHRRILATDSKPVASYAGDFDGDRRMDLVTLNRGSNTLTYFSNVGGASPTARALPSGGETPISALVRDVDSDGIDDLIVANRDDGSLALFQGGEQGLTLSQTITSPGGRPTALAVGNQPIASWQFYVADVGSDTVVLMGFEPGTTETEGEVIPNPDPSTPVSPPDLGPGPTRFETTLGSLSQGSVDLVPMLLKLPGDIEDYDPLLEDGVAGPDQYAGRQSKSMPGSTSGGGEEVVEESLPDASPTLAGASEEQLKMQRFLSGVDETPAPSLTLEGASVVVEASTPVSSLPSATSTWIDPGTWESAECFLEDEGDSDPYIDQTSLPQLLETAHEPDVLMLVIAVGLALEARWRVRWTVVEGEREERRARPLHQPAEND